MRVVPALLVLSFLLAGPSSALKGERRGSSSSSVRTRAVQQLTVIGRGPVVKGPTVKEGGPPVEEEGGPPVTEEGGPPVKEGGLAADPKATKEVKTKETEADPEEAKDVKTKEKKREKKCKAPKAKKPTAAEDNAPKASPIDSTEQTGDEQYCLHGMRTEEECRAAREGVLPADDKSVRGDVKLEIFSYDDDDKSDEEVTEKIQEILKQKISPKFIGCDMRRLLQEDETPTDAEPAEEVAEDEVSVTGVDFGPVTKAAKGCAVADDNCSKYETDVEIFYEGGKATAQDKEDMFALLGETIENESRAFAEVGELSTVESSGSGSGGAKTAGLVAGVVVGALAAIGVGYYMIRRKKSKGNNNKQSRRQGSGKDGNASENTSEASSQDGGGDRAATARPVQSFANVVGVGSGAQNKTGDRAKTNNNKPVDQQSVSAEPCSFNCLSCT